MNELHIKVTVNPSMLQSYCNTGAVFKNGNGHALPTLPNAVKAIKEHAERINSLADIITNVNTTETFYRAKLQDTTPEELIKTIGAAILPLIAGGLKIDAAHIKTTIYNKTKLALTCGLATITIQITRA